MPRKIRMASEHRIPVNDSQLFDELRRYALRHDLTWAEALRTLLTFAQQNDGDMLATVAASKEPMDGMKP